MPASAKKKKDSAAKALAAAETEATKEAEKTSFGNGGADLQLSKEKPVDDKTVDFHQHDPVTFKGITAIFIDQASIMVMISAYESYRNQDKFDEFLSMNVDIAKKWWRMVISPRKLSRNFIALCIWLR